MNHINVLKYESDIAECSDHLDRFRELLREGQHEPPVWTQRQHDQLMELSNGIQDLANAVDDLAKDLRNASRKD